MNKLLRQLSAVLFSHPKRDFYLPALRVYVSLHIIKKVILQWSYANMLYGADSYAEWSKKIFGLIPVEYLQPYCLHLCALYLAVAGMMMLGIGRRITVLVTCSLCWIFQAWQGYTLNGGDNLLKFILLYLCFADSFRRFALNPSQPNKGIWKKWNNLLTKTAVFLILGHQCLIYLISGLAKAHAEVWYTGEALYYILQIDRFAGSEFNQWLIRSPWIITAATFGTMIWELFFPILIWLPRIRPWVLLAGLGMHLGIYICMMIHDFEVLFLSIYGLYFTNREWRYIIRWSYRKAKLFTSSHQRHYETDIIN